MKGEPRGVVSIPFSADLQNDRLLGSAALPSPPALPGPEADEWIDWACKLKEPEDAESLKDLRNGFARVDEFIANLEPEMWTVKKEVLV